MKKYLLTLLSLLVLGASYTTAQADDLDGLTQITSLSDLTDGNYYYIVADRSSFYKNHGKSVAFYYDSSNPGNLYWNQLNTSETDYAFKITSAGTEGSYYICSYSGFYPSGASSNLITLSTTATPVTIKENTTSNDKGMGVAGTFLITASYTGSYRYYTDASRYGGNTKGQVGCNNWSVSTGTDSLCTYSYWRIYKITDGLQEKIDNADAETIAKQTAIAALKSELAKYNGTENYVFGITAENYSAAEKKIGSLTTNNTLEEINAVKIEDYVTKLTTGYYRLQNPYWGNMDYTHSIMRLDGIKRAFFDVDATTDSTYKSDLSTVCYITVPEDQENSLTPTGLTITSQGCRLTNVGSGSALYASESSSATARLLRSSGTNAHAGERNIQISNANNEYTSNSYVYKSGDGDNPARVLRPLSYDAPSGRFSFIKATDIIVNMNSVANDDSTYATLYAPFAVTLPDGLTAYTGTLNTGNNSLTLSPIKSSVVPAATPVVLIGTETSYTLDIAADDNSDPISSAFTGQYLADIDENTGIYTLGAKNDVVGFYPYENAIKANKARLNLSSSDSKGFTFSFGDDDPTGINSATTSGAVLKVGDVIYDLQGRRVQDAKHGIYIINGKKTVVK